MKRLTGMAIGLAICIWLFFPYDMLGAGFEPTMRRFVCVLIVGMAGAIGTGVSL